MQSAPFLRALRRLAQPWAARWRARNGSAAAGTAADLNHDGDAAVTAVMVGATCCALRLERHAGSARLHLTQAGQGGREQLRVWQAAGWFKGASVVLVLGSSERHFLTLDRPELPPEELALAARYPLAEALEADAEELLTTATPMPQTNEALRPQMLAVAARLGPVREQLALLSAAGIRARHIDIADSALRGMVLLQGKPDEGCVALSLVGEDICIGLIWQHQFCALRSLALPPRTANDDAEYEEQLALHIQRTADHFERQATRLSVRSVLASMPAMTDDARRAVLSALPLPAQVFDVAAVLAVDEAAAQACAGHNDLTALAGVAAARLLEPLAQQAAEQAEQNEAAAGDTPLATGYEPMGLTPMALSQTVIAQAALDSRTTAQGPAGDTHDSAYSSERYANYESPDSGALGTADDGNTAGPFDTPLHGPLDDAPYRPASDRFGNSDDTRRDPPAMALEDRL